MEIEIDILDDLAYAKAARILDQDAFMNRVNAIRNSWGLKNFIRYQNFQDWLNEPHIDYSFTAEAAETLNSTNERLETDVMHGNMSFYDEYDKNKQLSDVRVIDFELEYTLHKLNLDLSLKPMLLKTIVCNKVKAEDLPDDRMTNEGLHKGWLFDDLYYGYKNIEAKLDKKPEIKRDREWYWLKKSGLTYLRIAQTTKYRGKIDPKDFEGNVKKQIKRYKKFLKGGHLATH